ncbi:MAG: 2-dehydro-3-deoxyphosphooctonate aldolase (KDO 8-P synthase) [Granulosicoccus sp.]|jgi:2-dehydro-3-deoxyphosphooctonate aldolase (KDO 8-P synthase)
MPSATIAGIWEEKQSKMDKLILIAGPCAIENKETPFAIATELVRLAEKFNLRLIFKGSYRKANRTDLNSFTGIGDEAALEILQEIGQHFNVETITDIHESHEAELATKYVDHIQIPAFLCRQTELLLAAGNHATTVNIKKGQFLSPESMKFPLEKVQSTKCEEVWLTERGTTFGYNELVVDATAIYRMKALGAKVIMDCTHATQKPNKTEGITGGDPAMIETLALSAIATGADGLFIETHPEPSSAKSDPHTMLQLDKLESLLEKVIRVRLAVGH